MSHAIVLFVFYYLARLELFPPSYFPLFMTKWGKSTKNPSPNSAITGRGMHCNFTQSNIVQLNPRELIKNHNVDSDDQIMWKSTTFYDKQDDKLGFRILMSNRQFKRDSIALCTSNKSIFSNIRFRGNLYWLIRFFPLLFDWLQRSNETDIIELLMMLL